MWIERNCITFFINNNQQNDGNNILPLGICVWDSETLLTWIICNVNLPENNPSEWWPLEKYYRLVGIQVKGSHVGTGIACTYGWMFDKWMGTGGLCTYINKSWIFYWEPGCQLTLWIGSNRNHEGPINRGTPFPYKTLVCQRTSWSESIASICMHFITDMN